MEPFQDNHNIDEYKKRLGIKQAAANSSCKIWVFIDDVVECLVIKDKEQHLTIKLVNQQTNITVVVTLVYVKYSQQERLILWDSLEDMAQAIQGPWLVGVDFNVIVSKEEKIGGLLVIVAEIEVFNYCINLYGLEDVGFKGSKYTW